MTIVSDESGGVGMTGRGRMEPGARGRFTSRSFSFHLALSFSLILTPSTLAVIRNATRFTA